MLDYKNKKWQNQPIILCLLILSILTSCGGERGNSSSAAQTGSSSVSIMFHKTENATGVQARALPPEINKLSFTISAPDISTINKDVVITAEQTYITETFSIPNGDNRYFLIEAKNTSGVVLFKGDTTANLTGGTVALDILLIAQTILPTPLPPPPITPAPTPDTIPPTVQSVSPTIGAIGVSINSTITATFNEAMDAATINTTTFILSDGVGGVTGTVTYIGTTAIFTPLAPLLYNTQYTATITTGVKDLAGNAMLLAYQWSFTTKSPPGSLDTTFGNGGIVTTKTGIDSDIANAIAIQLDGKIVVAGETFNPLTSNNDFTIAQYNADGTLNTSFGISGIVTTNIISLSDDFARAIAIQSDGKIIVAGGSSNGNFDFAIARYNTNGTLDTSFGTNSSGIVTTNIIGTNIDDARAVAIQSDSKIIAAGYTWNPLTYNMDFVLVRYNSNGILDTTFNSTGIVITDIAGWDDTAYAIAIQADGKIIATGETWTGSSKDFAIVRYDINGNLDNIFGINGIVITDIAGWDDTAYAIAIQTDAKIVAAGSTWNLNDDFALVRYNTDGTLDTAFNNTGVVTTNIMGVSADIAYSVVIQSDGKIITAGSTQNLTTFTYDFALVRYNVDGILDTTFDTDGIVTTDIGGNNNMAYASAIQLDGKIVAVGETYNSITFTTDFALTRYLP